MANDYTTMDQVRAYVYQSQDADEEFLKRIITRASRIVDSACAVSEGYFAKGNSSTAASARYFWGNGSDYLKVDPYLSATTPTVTMPTGFAVLNWIESNPYTPEGTYQPCEFFLVRRYGDDYSSIAALAERRDYFFAEFSNQVDYVGWPAGIRVTATAKWGWDSVPADIAEATLEIIAQIWRSKDAGFARAVAVDGVPLIQDALTPRARLILDGYKVGRGMFA